MTSVVLLYYVSFAVTVMTVMVIAVGLRQWNCISRTNRILKVAEIHLDISDTAKHVYCQKIDDLKTTTLEVAAEVKKTTAESFKAVNEQIDATTARIIGVAIGEGGSGIVEPMSPNFRRMLVNPAT